MHLLLLVFDSSLLRLHRQLLLAHLIGQLAHFVTLNVKHLLIILARVSKLLGHFVELLYQGSTLGLLVITLVLAEVELDAQRL